MEAPGIRVTLRSPRGSTGDALRADVVGFGGIFDRGPIFAAFRVEDQEELRREFGGNRMMRSPTVNRPALAPLALHGFYQNGGGTAVIARVAGPGARSAAALIRDPATGAEIGLIASSAGAWANGVELTLPLRVQGRKVIAGFPLALADAGPLKSGAIVRVSAKARPGTFVFGTVSLDGSGKSLEFRSQQPAPIGELIVDVLEPEVDITIDGPLGRENFRTLSLDPTHPRYLWRYLELPGAESRWSSRGVVAEGTRDWIGSDRSGLDAARIAEVPTSWGNPVGALALSLAHQGPARSRQLRAVLPTQFGHQLEAGVLELRDVGWPRPPDGEWVNAKHLDVSAVNATAVLEAGSDDLRNLDADGFRAIFSQLANHPAPSIITVPDLMVSLAPELPACDRKPFDHPTLEPEPTVGPCGERIEPPVFPIFQLPSTPALPSELADEVPQIDAETALSLQLDLLLSLVSNPDSKGDRVALLDPVPGLVASQAIDNARGLQQRIRGAGARTPYLASLGIQLFPWLRITDPFAPGTVRALPPSGHIAGISARKTREGVPGTRFANESIEAVVGVNRALSDTDRALLNDGHICAIHAAAGRGVRLLGARTLSQRPAPERYVPAAQVIAYLRRALRELGRTLVFAPNDPLLHLKIRVALEALLGDLHRAGVLVGRTPDEAYRVRCDETTTPPERSDAGIVEAEVQVAPSIPLEFVEVRIAFTRDGVGPVAEAA